MSFDDLKDSFLPNSLFRETAQVCIVTRDLDALMRTYVEHLGIGPWWVQEYRAPELTDAVFRGRPGTFSMRLALAWTGRLNWELIQPLDGPSIYHEFLDARGEGMQHVGVLLDDMGMSWDECHAAFRARGMEPIQEGCWGGVRFCYFDTEGPARIVFEVIDRPEGWERPAPLYWYPEPRVAASG
jgi:catechol 2,3-dioxygenase-like lactoylglutathione lyase family enzyme